MEKPGINNHANEIDFYFGGYTAEFTATHSLNVCYYQLLNNDNTLWRKSIPWTASIPILTELSIIILASRLLFVVFNFAHQPRFFAEMMSALALGPIIIGKNEWFATYIRPLNSTAGLETLANLGLFWYIFLVGLQIDLRALRKIEKRALCNVMAGILFPFAIGAGLHFLFVHKHESSNPLGAFFWAVALTVTSFTDLARILSDLKLLHLDIGRMALSSAMFNEVAAFTFLVLIVTFLNGQAKYYILPTFSFILFFWFMVRPVLSWMIEKTSPKAGNYNDLHICFILAGAAICGFISDACGSYSLIGAFMFGLTMPNGDFAMKIIEKIDDLVTGILMPSFFVITGIRTNAAYQLLNNTTVSMLVAVILLACLAKVVSTLIVSFFCGIPYRASITLGVLMNTKGILALIVLNVGRDIEALDYQTFSVMVIALMVMTVPVKLVPYYAYKSTKAPLKHYKHRTMEESNPNSELRILMCIYCPQNLSGLTNLVKFSKSTIESPINVFAAHLVDFTKASTSMLLVHDSDESTSQKYHINQEEDHQRTSKGSQAVSVQPLTVVSPFATMHKDIFTLAEENLVSLILIPFHKRSNTEGAWREVNSSIRKVNKNLLARLPCSVGIFIDRGLGSGIHDNKQQLRFAVLLTGGPDSREALAYASRMVGSHQDVKLTIIRFLPDKEAENMIKGLVECDRERQICDEYVNEFRFRTMCDQSISYIEKLVNTGAEIMTTIKTMLVDYDLYIVGKGQKMISPFTMGLLDWSDCEELGALGDALSTSEFAKHASILVIQQYQHDGAAKQFMKEELE